MFVVKSTVVENNQFTNPKTKYTLNYFILGNIPLFTTVGVWCTV